MMRNKRQKRPGKGIFNPEDEHIEQHSLGVWDLYVQRNKSGSRFFGDWMRFEDHVELFNDLPYLWRAIHDLRHVCAYLLAVYGVTTAIMAVIPAVSLW